MGLLARFPTDLIDALVLSVDHCFYFLRSYHASIGGGFLAISVDGDTFVSGGAVENPRVSMSGPYSVNSHMQGIKRKAIDTSASGVYRLEACILEASQHDSHFRRACHRKA